LILSAVRDGTLDTTTYEQSDTHLVYTGTWTATSATAASNGSHRFANSSGSSCTVAFTGTYIAWQAKKSPLYGLARLTLDGTDMGTVDLYNATAVYGQVWDTTVERGTHSLKIEWTGEKNASATATNISVDAFKIAGTIAQAQALTRYQQAVADSGGALYPFYLGTWSVSSTTAASGGSFRYMNKAGSCSVTFNGTYFAWYGKKSPVYGIAKVTVDGEEAATVDLFAATAAYGKVWDVTVGSGVHTVTIAWTGTKNSSASNSNISIDAFDIMGTIQKAPPWHQQDAAGLTYEGSWATFSTSGASSGSYLRASGNDAKVTIKFKGSYLVWIATKGTTLGKALVSLDGGTAVSVNLAASAVAYQQPVWNTGIQPYKEHTVIITRDPSSAAGKYISVDAIEVVGALVTE
jgi:hypothetical protein